MCVLDRVWEGESRERERECVRVGVSVCAGLGSCAPRPAAPATPHSPRHPQVYSNGDMYEGLWDTGRPHGPGRYVWADGNEYDGTWALGARRRKGLRPPCVCVFVCAL